MPANLIAARAWLDLARASTQGDNAHAIAMVKHHLNGRSPELVTTSAAELERLRVEAHLREARLWRDLFRTLPGNNLRRIAQMNAELAAIPAEPEDIGVTPEEGCSAVLRGMVQRAFDREMNRQKNR